AYLCFEGAEKVWGRLRGHGPHAAAGPGGAAALPDEDALVKGAVRTDLVLSAEIMVIALDEVVSEPFLTRAVVLAVVGLAVTVGVYGVVALIVKMDDAGLRLAEAPSAAVARLGRWMVAALPKRLTLLTVVGTAAMLWVGGHLLLVGADELGLTAPYEVVHHAEEAVAEALGAAGPVAGWFVATLAAAVLGLLVGLLVVAAVHAVEVVRHRRGATDGVPSAH
ncbi:DUF808 family protein, partial [Promicromonospora citrea]|uniref:DUF808 family protein n=1 Tax=Promicromonospora citrea TaxID=43677 RepID=UPI001488B835